MTSDYLPALGQELIGNSGLILDGEEEFFSSFPQDDNGPPIESTASFDFSGTGSCGRTSQLFGAELDHPSLCDQADGYFPSNLVLEGVDNATHGASGRDHANIYHSPSVSWSTSKECSHTFDLYQQRDHHKSTWNVHDAGTGGDCGDTGSASLSKPDMEISETWQTGSVAFGNERGDSVPPEYFTMTKFGEWYTDCPGLSVVQMPTQTQIQSSNRNDVTRGMDFHEVPAAVQSKAPGGSLPTQKYPGLSITELATSAEHSKLPQAADAPILWTARYSLSASSYADTSGEGIVMSACKKEWFDKLNLPKRDVLRGQVQAVGELRTNDQGIARKLMVVEPKQHSVPIIHPLLRVPICELSALPGPKSQTPRMIPLGRPCFSPFEPGMLAIADEQHPTLEATHTPRLVVSSVQRSPVIRIKNVATAPLKSPASALAWLSSNRILVSSGTTLSIMKLNDSVLRMRSQLPAFHTDDIRDIQLYPFQTSLCLSAGYDSEVFITDLERVVRGRAPAPLVTSDVTFDFFGWQVSDQLGSVRSSQNLKYCASDPVSSVAWNPLMGNLASVTCDTGYLHTFDPRASNDRRTSVLATGTMGLNTHAWADAHAILLGYGDGSLRLFDMRKMDECVIMFHDPHVQQIGDVVFDPQRRYLLTFGNPRFSVWRFDSQRFTLSHHDPDCVSKAHLDEDIYYKLSGSFMLTGGRQHGIFGTTDACGVFSLYGEPSEGSKNKMPDDLFPAVFKPKSSTNTVLNP